MTQSVPRPGPEDSPQDKPKSVLHNRAVRAGLGVPLAVAAMCCSGIPSWWFHIAPGPLEAAVFAVVFGTLVGVTAAVWLGLRPGQRRRIVLVALASLWAAVCTGWFVHWRVVSGTAKYPLGAAMVFLVLTGCGGALLVAWLSAGRRHTRAFLTGIGALVAAAVLAVVGGFYELTGGFWTKGDTISPANAAENWVEAGFPGYMEKPNMANVNRLTCGGAGGKQALGVLAEWQRAAQETQSTYEAEWFNAKTEMRGTRATVVATVYMKAWISGGQSIEIDQPPWTFTMVNDNGWRVCGLYIPPAAKSSPSPGASDSTDPSASTSPSGQPSGPPNSPPAGNPGVPPDMQRCGKDDPYRSFGFYTCPPG